MINRFNNLTSKEWLPFQKSWYKHTADYDLYKQNIRFFIKFDHDELAPNLLFWGSENQLKTIQKLKHELNFNLFSKDQINKAQTLQFAFIDLRDYLNTNSTIEEYLIIKKEILNLLYSLNNKIAHRRFISIQLPNLYSENKFTPIAWDLGKTLSHFYSLKDEKIAWEKADSKSHFYSLYFRNDEKSKYEKLKNNSKFICSSDKYTISNSTFDTIPSCYILKPKARNKKEVLHPAKYPEDLTEMHIKAFTKEGDNVFDPMSGTGSTQLSAVKLNRNAYGTELSDFFHEIAQNRCEHYLQENPNSSECKILCQDARKIKPKDFPLIDYIITSPPYWDMLNMKGAENQAKRIKKGLQVNYSDSTEDLGNIEDYNDFLDDLTSTYFNLIKILKPGGFFTIVVKNIKKKGSNYPFAWDLSERLKEKLILLPETFWLQDDISIAPYGYFNTYVSNTFHQYCLNFQKPF